MEPTQERAILDLRSAMDDDERAAFEADLRTAFSLPVDRHAAAIEVVLRSWTSRRELQTIPDAPTWFS